VGEAQKGKKFLDIVLWNTSQNQGILNFTSVFESNSQIWGENLDR
jgi:uncharacterized membrane protein